MLMLGASAVWVGTRFVVANEAGSSQYEKDTMLAADIDATLKSTIWTGRPLRHLKTKYTQDWETRRRGEIEDLQSRGILVMEHELERLSKEGKLTDEIEEEAHFRPAGVVAALVNKKDQSAGEIVEEMATEAYELLRGATRFVGGGAKL